MKRPISLLLCVALVLGLFPGRASAAVNVERHGTENPVVEVFRSTVYGFLAGVVVGGAIALAVQDESSTDDIMRWSVVSGTMVGLGAGIYWVTKRPQPTGMLELRDGSLRLHPVALQLESGGGASVRLVGVRF